MNECKKCGAPMKWVKSKAGKWMPLDAEPLKVVTQDADGDWVVVTAYTSHFATCPNADEFRKGD